MPTGKNKALVNQRRLKKPEDNFMSDWPGFNFRNIFDFETSGEPVLITDPIYLADVYNSHDPDAEFMRAHGVFIGEFGGGGAPVWWQAPYLVIPTSWDIEDSEPPVGVDVLFDEIVTDSCTFVFLPVTKNLPKSLKKKVKQVLSEDNAASLTLPAGKWTVFYEQRDTIGENQDEEHFRNIVLKWQALS
jgi:hypothetical protein